MTNQPSSVVAAPESKRETVYLYHDRTKHHLERYARSLGYMDWASQPNPFRRFEGARLIPLPLPRIEAEPTYDAISAAGSRAGLRSALRPSATCSSSAWRCQPGSRWRDLTAKSRHDGRCA